LNAHFALAAQFDGGLIFVGVGGVIRGAVFDLTGKDIADQLAKLDGIAGTREALCCHPDSMPSVSTGRYRSRQFKLYHYRRITISPRHGCYVGISKSNKRLGH
jgi:hypothetical protein